MGAQQAKCCTPQEVPDLIDGKAAIADPSTSDDALAKPLWLIEAEEQKALRAIREEEAVKRLAELAAKKQLEIEEQKKAEAEAEAEKAAEAASAKAGPKKKAVGKKAAAPAANPHDPVPVVKKKTAEDLQREADVKKKIDEATKAVEDVSKVRYDIEVKCVSARNLRDADWAPGGGTSDPYCLCEVNGKAKSRFKTKTVDNAENPVWNQAAKMQLAQGDGLKFTINDEDTGKNDDLLGWSELNFDQMMPSGFEGELKLRDASDTPYPRAAYVKVRIRLMGATVLEQ